MIVYVSTQYYKIVMQQQKSSLKKYNQLKHESTLPLKLKLYFSMLENGLQNYYSVSKSNKSPSKTNFSKSLLVTFNDLSIEEKGRYLYESLTHVLDQMDRYQKDRTKADSILIDGIQNIQTTCQVLFTTLKINRWATFHFKLDKNKRMIYLDSKKKKLMIDIHQYFVRKSKKYKTAIVMGAIVDQVPNEAKKYIINFSNSIVHRIYEEIFKCVILCQSEGLLVMAEEQDEEENQSSHNQGNNRALIILSSNNINQYLEYKDKTIKDLMTKKFDFKKIYKSEQLQTIIEKSTKYDHTYRMESTIDHYKGNIKQDFISALYNRNKYIQQTQILESFSKKYKAIYERYTINHKFQEMISIREENLSTNEEEVIFMKTIQNILNLSYLDYMYVRIRSSSAVKARLVIFIGVNSTKKSILEEETAKRFLIELYEMIFREQPFPNIIKSISKQERKRVDFKPQVEFKKDEDNESDDEDQFKTVKGESQQFVEVEEGDDDQDYIQNCSQKQKKVEQHNNLVLLNSNRPIEKIEEMIEFNHFDQTSNEYLKNRFLLEPILGSQQSQKNRMKDHYLFTQWARRKGGGIVCINETKIATQKNLFRLAITKYGKNFLKGQILRISLPIEIFRKQSHLQTIGRNVSYAPLFLERFSEYNMNQKPINMAIALERVKYSTLLAISIGTVGILMDKPFNPILGETIQLWLDGCPLYVEQISHHPPLSSYYMVGRGYTMHGIIQPKISFGMNSIRGYSARPNYIKFFKYNENKEPTNEVETQIEMILGKMVIKGMLFGERQFNFEDKIYVFDKKNLIFSEIIYGPTKKSSKSKLSNYSDYVHGQIFQVQKEFLSKFTTSNSSIYPKKDDIIKTLSIFQGIWNDIFTFDGIEYVNFKTDLPCQIIPQSVPLPSNSSYRTDLQWLIKDNLPQAQKQKDRMEDMQRWDKKLRQSDKTINHI